MRPVAVRSSDVSLRVSSRGVRGVLPMFPRLRLVQVWRLGRKFVNEDEMVDGYWVPVDPFDLQMCDSCQ